MRATSCAYPLCSSCGTSVETLARAPRCATMTLMETIKRHDTGPAVEDVQQRLVLGRQVREGDEGAGQKAQPEVVVAQRERRAHAFGQLAHEAEQARVPALFDAVEHHAFEGEAPVLPFVAHKLHLARVAVQIDVADARDVVG